MWNNFWSGEKCMCVHVCKMFVCVWRVFSVWNFKIDSLPLSRAKTNSLSCCLTTQCESWAVIQQCREFTQVFFSTGVVLELALICTLHHLTTRAEKTGTCAGLCQDLDYSSACFPYISAGHDNMYLYVLPKRYRDLKTVVGTALFSR